MLINSHSKKILLCLSYKLKSLNTYKFVTSNCNITLESAMGRVVLEHVDHVVQGDERIIDSDNFDA